MDAFFLKSRLNLVQALGLCIGCYGLGSPNIVLMVVGLMILFLGFLNKKLLEWDQ